MYISNMRPSQTIKEFQVHSPHIRILFAQERPTGNWKFKELRAPYWRLYHQSAPGAWIQQEQERIVLALVQSCLAGCQLQLVNRSDNSRLEEAQALMRRHLRDGISNPEIASALAMTTNAFIRWFSQSTGWPPQKWLNRERVHEASYWLHHNNASIDFIAETVGFCDRYHFSRVFKKIQGISPASFRKNREKLDAQLKV